MKIYLLLIDQERHFFYSDIGDEPEFDEHEPSQSTQQHSGLRGWSQRKLKTFQDDWNHANHGPMHWMHRLWDWMHSFAHPDEAMLVRLRRAKRISLHYPANRSEAEVSEIWRGYLTQQLWKHWLWLVINGTITPFAVALAILPGPNVIGYWFLYRAIHHSLVVYGIRRVRSGAVLTEYHPTPQLDIPVSSSADGTSSHPALRPQASDLREHVTRRQSKP